MAKCIVNMKRKFLSAELNEVGAIFVFIKPRIEDGFNL